MEAAVAQQPLRERLREYLMVALYRAGRPADALAAYRDARRTWVEELGINPGRRLRQLERDILVQDPALDLPAADVPAAARYSHDERKLVTVLLADVVAAEDLERTRSWLDHVREVASAEVEAAGGVIGSSTGGGILATFGAPAAQEDHAERALGVAKALQARLGAALPLRIAVETGEIIAGRSGVSGPPVSLAMQLLSGAKSGDVLLGRRASAAHTRRKPGHGSPRVAPLVGREAELDAIRAEYRRACADARARLVTIVGDAGVGKSRLVKEFVAGLPAQSPAPYALTGSCISYGHALTYRALGDVLREVLGVRESDSRDNILERLGPRQILGLTLGLDVAGELHPLAAVERLRVAWRDLLRELVADRPTVVVVEDLHWAQADLLDLLEVLLDGVAGPLLLVGTARPELLTSRPSWGRRRDASTVWLEPLAREDAARLVAQAPEHVREAVLEKAEGNPFFIEELVAQVRAGAEATVIPDSVQAVLAARIDRLPPLEKHALQAAAVVGRAFWREPVRELLGDALPNFELLEERDFIRPRTRSSFEGMRELVFKHALTREVAYGSLPRREKAAAARERRPLARRLRRRPRRACGPAGPSLRGGRPVRRRRPCLAGRRRRVRRTPPQRDFMASPRRGARDRPVRDRRRDRAPAPGALARGRGQYALRAVDRRGQSECPEVRRRSVLDGNGDGSEAYRRRLDPRRDLQPPGRGVLRSRRHVDTNSGAGSSRTVGGVRAPAGAAGNGVARTRADREGMPGHRRPPCSRRGRGDR